MIVANLDLHQPIWPDTGGEGIITHSITVAQANVLLIFGLALVVVLSWFAQRWLATPRDAAAGTARSHAAIAVIAVWSAVLTFQVTRTAITTDDLAGPPLIALTLVAGYVVGMRRARGERACALVWVATLGPAATAVAAGVTSERNGVLVFMFDAALLVFPLLLLMALTAPLGKLATRPLRRGNAPVV